MKNLTLKHVLSGKAFASYELIDKLKELNLKDNDILVNFAFSDYGGDFFDRIAIEYLQENYPNSIIVENTCYYGKNAILFGDIAKEFIESCSNYPLGFERLEDYYYQKYNEAQEQAYTDIIKEYCKVYAFNNDYDKELSENIQNHILNYLRQNMDFCVLSSGYCDYSEIRVNEYIDKFIATDLQMILSKEREEKTDTLFIGKLF